MLPECSCRCALRERDPHMLDLVAQCVEGGGTTDHHLKDRMLGARIAASFHERGCM